MITRNLEKGVSQDFTCPWIGSHRVDVSAQGASGSRTNFPELPSSVNKHIFTVFSKKVQEFVRESEDHGHIKGI